MESRTHALDLGKELTCSICTELLYQPLTLLDCLHTYCGACLKEWFRFQAEKVGRARTPPPPDAIIFTCPSCRSSVRDTRHNATVATLLEMYTAANPNKQRPEADKREMEEKYKPGDQVLPKVKTRERTAEEKRLEEEDRRLMDEVREMSLREAVEAAMPESQQARSARRHADGRSSDGRARSNSEYRSDGHPQRARDGTGRNGQSNAEYLSPEGESQSRSRRSESRQRQVEHQSSLRSLIGSEMSERDIEREIEEFARQIQEEGLLDGLDLDNIDLSRDDELSQRITEAYRRRQRGRSRQEQPERRPEARAQNSASSRSRDSRLRPDNARPQSRHRAHSRSTSEVGDRNRPPVSPSANLGVREPERRARRRTTSGGYHSTTAVPPNNGSSLSSMDARPAAHSQNDLGLRREHSDFDPSASVPALRIGRSSSSTAVPAAAHPADTPPRPNGNIASFASRTQSYPSTSTPSHAIPPELMEITAARNSKQSRPTEVVSPPASLVSSPVESPMAAPSRHQRTQSQLFEEPSISCSRCRKANIQYDVHYNCRVCHDGHWNLCVDCYRSGKGCLYWFGFGYGAWKKWEKRKQADDTIAMPHMLNAGRYMRPASTTASADGKKTMTTDEPRSRLETGTFCARCFAWTNECFWRCDVCNEGDWGFCNNCVNEGKSCSHRLLPLAHEATLKSTYVPRSPRSGGRPSTATVITASQLSGVGPFRPLSFRVRCDICKDTVPPSELRYHCFSCSSTAVQDATPGDYDICTSCYSGLESKGDISEENGSSGWRRCPSGHRMAIVGFMEGKLGHWRFVEKDVVGGRALRSEPLENIAHPDFMKWSWYEANEKRERLVTTDVSATAPERLGEIVYARDFPPDGGSGLTAHAMWAWYPKPGAEDELMFPRGADIQEIRDLNGDWFFGTYMGAKGVFPAPYVKLPQQP